jgi:hypothetical protein
LNQAEFQREEEQRMKAEKQRAKQEVGDLESPSTAQCVIFLVLAGRAASKGKRTAEGRGSKGKTATRGGVVATTSHGPSN